MWGSAERGDRFPVIDGDEDWSFGRTPFLKGKL
jgi:hypothetical protein